MFDINRYNTILITFDVIQFSEVSHGGVCLGRDCVLHPSSRVAALRGPIVLGDGNIVEECAELVNRCGGGVGRRT